MDEFNILYIHIYFEVALLARINYLGHVLGKLLLSCSLFVSMLYQH